MRAPDRWPGGSYGSYVGTSSTQLPLRTQISIK
jgi:hypothetical protein